MCKCLRCEHEMIKVKPENFINPYKLDENPNYSEYSCSYCGTYYTVEGISEEEKHTVPKYNEELRKDFIDEFHDYKGLCPECGKHIVLSSEFMRSKIIGDVNNEEDDALVSYVFCPYCGSMTEIIEPKPSELKKFPISKENINDF